MTMLLAISGLAMAAATIGELSIAGPPPPSRYLEFFNPMNREHSVTVRCAGISARADWTFAEGRISFTKLTHAATYTASATDLARLDAAAAEMAGDVFVDLRCNRDAAGIALIDADRVGTSRAVRRSFGIVDGRLVRLDR